MEAANSNGASIAFATITATISLDVLVEMQPLDASRQNPVENNKQNVAEWRTMTPNEKYRSSEVIHDWQGQRSGLIGRRQL